VIRDPERRADRRWRAADDHGVVSTRIVPGSDARLVDVSAGGALVDTPLRLLPGANVEVRLATRQQRIAVRGQVVRCFVARLQPVVYRGAVRFDQRLQMFEGSATGHPLPAREEITHGLI
jgi:PilZ domain